MLENPILLGPKNDYKDTRKKVNPAISTSLKVADIIAFQVYIIRDMKKVYSFCQSSKHFTAEEIRYIIAIFLSCLGVFGLAMFTAHVKTKEIGIRKVLGATLADIVTLLCRDFIVLIVIAIGIASPVAWYLMHDWLSGFAYKIDLTVWIFVFAGMASLLLGLITVSFHAIKA